MRRSRRGYLMAMLSGMTIVGAATVGVTTTTTRQQDSLAAAAAQEAKLLSSSEASIAPLDDASRVPDASDGGPADPGPAEIAAVGPAAPDTHPARSGAPTSTAPSTGGAGRDVDVDPTAHAMAPGTSARAVVPSTGDPKTPRPTKSASTYKDGRYSTVSKYLSPSGDQELGVTLTLRADTVTAVSLDLRGDAGLAHMYQLQFESGYTTEVVGRNIDAIEVGVVAGSSLTGIGFASALDQIEEQARA